MRFWPCLCLVLLAPRATADEVYLKGGGRVAGVVVDRTASSVVIEVAPGQVAIPSARIERIVLGSGDLAIYEGQAARLAEGDAAGWLALARWAEDRGLRTQARAALDRVLAADAGNATAHRMLGHVLLGDRWVTAEEAHRAAGRVEFEGEWVTPAEREVELRERQHRDAERELALRVAAANQAEARARDAEEQARRAAEAAQSAEIPWGAAVWPWNTGPWPPYPATPLWPSGMGPGGHRSAPACPRPPGPKPRPNPPGPAPRGDSHGFREAGYR